LSCCFPDFGDVIVELRKIVNVPRKGASEISVFWLFSFGMFPYIICFPHLSGHMFFLRPGWITFVVDCALWRAVVPWWWMCTQWSLIFHWLVVWNMAFMTFHSVGNVIIPTDELIFFRRGRSTTKQFMIPGCLGLGLGWPWPDPAPCGAMWRHVAHHVAHTCGGRGNPWTTRRGWTARCHFPAVSRIANWLLWRTDVRGPGRRPIHAPVSEVMSCGWKGCGEWVVQNGENLNYHIYPYLGGVNICLPASRCSAEVHGLGPSPNPNVESQMLRFTLR